jgi:aspartyl-tRNA(Asn)/glutamyl-tRNA(Gln) amidotransferase subunit A
MHTTNRPPPQEVKQRILLGTFSLSAGYADAYYLKSQQLRAVLSHSFADAFQQADVLVCPTAPRCAYPLGRAAKSKVEMYADDLFTVPASLAGLPAISLPTAASPAAGGGGVPLPIGFQIIGRRFGEDEALRVARAFELARDG